MIKETNKRTEATEMVNNQIKKEIIDVDKRYNWVFYQQLVEIVNKCTFQSISLLIAKKTISSFLLLFLFNYIEDSIIFINSNIILNVFLVLAFPSNGLVLISIFIIYRHSLTQEHNKSNLWKIIVNLSKIIIMLYLFLLDIFIVPLKIMTIVMVFFSHEHNILNINIRGNIYLVGVIGVYIFLVLDFVIFLCCLYSFTLYFNNPIPSRSAEASLLSTNTYIIKLLWILLILSQGFTNSDNIDQVSFSSFMIIIKVLRVMILLVIFGISFNDNSTFDSKVNKYKKTTQFFSVIFSLMKIMTSMSNMKIQITLSLFAPILYKVNLKIINFMEIEFDQIFSRMLNMKNKESGNQANISLIKRMISNRFKRKMRNIDFSTKFEDRLLYKDIFCLYISHFKECSILTCQCREIHNKLREYKSKNINSLIESGYTEEQRNEKMISRTKLFTLTQILNFIFQIEVNKLNDGKMKNWFKSLKILSKKKPVIYQLIAIENQNKTKESQTFHNLLFTSYYTYEIEKFTQDIFMRPSKHKGENNFKSLSNIIINLQRPFYYRSRLIEISKTINEFTKINKSFLDLLHNKAVSQSIILKFSARILNLRLECDRQLNLCETNSLNNEFLHTFIKYSFYKYALNRDNEAKISLNLFLGKIRKIHSFLKNQNSYILSQFNYIDKTVIFKTSADKLGLIYDIYGNYPFLKNIEYYRGKSMDCLLPQFVQNQHKKAANEVVFSNNPKITLNLKKGFIKIPVQGRPISIRCGISIKLSPIEKNRLSFLTAVKFHRSKNDFFILLDHSDDLKVQSYSLELFSILEQNNILLKRSTNLMSLCQLLYNRIHKKCNFLKNNLHLLSQEVCSLSNFNKKNSKEDPFLFKNEIITHMKVKQSQFTFQGNKNRFGGQKVSFVTEFDVEVITHRLNNTDYFYFELILEPITLEIKEESNSNILSDYFEQTGNNSSDEVTDERQKLIHFKKINNGNKFFSIDLKNQNEETLESSARREDSSLGISVGSNQVDALSSTNLSNFNSNHKFDHFNSSNLKLGNNLKLNLKPIMRRGFRMNDQIESPQRNKDDSNKEVSF